MSLPIGSRLRVVVDMDTLDTSDERTEYLLGLLRRDEFELYRYSDEGPPQDKIRDEPEVSTRYGVDWLLYEPSPDPDYDFRGRVAYSNNPPSWKASTVVAGDFLPVLVHHAAQRLSYTEDRHDQLSRDVTVLLIAQAASAHLLVTEREALQDLPGQIWRDKVQPCSVESALALVGFWLRAKGIYAFHATETGMAETFRQEFYAVLASDLLPSASRWGQACSLAGDQTLHDLAVSLSGRVVTALKTRDRAHTANFFMTDASAQDEGLECVDTVALYLMGAFDIAARVANQLLNVNEQPNRVGWQHKTWRKNLPADLRNAAVTHGNTVTIVRELRNTIHHRAMHIGTISNPQPEDADWYVVLPADSATELANAMRSTGGLESWGFRETVPGQLWVRPFVLIEQMIVKTTEALNDLLAAMTDPNLPAPTDPAPEPSIESWPWEKSSRRHIRWQVGGGLERRAEKTTRAAAQPS